MYLGLLLGLGRPGGLEAYDALRPGGLGGLEAMEARRSLRPESFEA